VQTFISDPSNTRTIGMVVLFVVYASTLSPRRSAGMSEVKATIHLCILVRVVVEREHSAQNDAEEPTKVRDACVFVVSDSLFPFLSYLFVDFNTFL
jgi:hypothetical protein